MIKFCPKCKSKNIWKRGFRKNKHSKKQKYHCKKCNHWFIESDGFERIIVKAIHLHNEGLSLFQVQDYLWQHEGVKVTRQAVGYWCNKYSIFLK